MSEIPFYTRIEMIDGQEVEVKVYDQKPRAKQLTVKGKIGKRGRMRKNKLKRIMNTL
jgi:hypothetical protein